MTIALRAAGTAIGGTTAVTAINPSVPSGAVVGDLSVLTVSVKPYTTTITTPSGWTKIDEHTSGTTAIGTDVGSTKVAMYVKEDAAVGAIGNIGQSGANSMGAVIHVYSKTKSTWDYSSFTKGADGTSGANYSATGAGGIDVAAGDWVVAGTSISGDIGTLSAWAIAGMSGATLGTSVNRTNSATTTGNDSRLTADDIPVNSGSSSNAPTYAYTNASNTEGATIWLRLRETTVSNVVRQKFTTGNDGDTITAGNTGASGVILTGGTAVIDTDVYYSATRSVFGDGTTTSGAVYWNLSHAQVDTYAADLYINLTALPSAEMAILWVGNGATRNLSLNITTTGQLRIRDAGGAGGVNIWTSTATVSTGLWYRYSIFATQHATAGTVRGAFFASNTSTPLDDSTLLTGKATGASPYNQTRWGIKAGVGVTTMSGNIDDYAYDLGPSDLIPPEPFTVSPPGIASDEAFGTVDVSMSGGATTVSPTAIASAEAFGTAVVSTPITLTPTGINSAEAFGTVSVTTPITLTPTAIGSAEAFGTVSVNAVTNVTFSGIASAEAFGTPTITIVGGPVTPTSIASAEAHGSPSITGILVTNPTAIGSAEALGSPTITAVITVSPGGIATANAFGTAVISTTIQLSPGGIASAEAFGTPVITKNITVSPTGIASAEAVPSPVVTTSGSSTPVSIPSAEAFGTVTVVTNQTVSPGGIASAGAYGSPTITGALTITLSGITSGETFGSPTIGGVLNVTLPGYGIGSHETVMAPTITANVTSTPTGIPTGNAWGTPNITLGAITVMAPSIQTQQAFGVVTVGGGNTMLWAEPVLSAEAFGVPYVVKWVPWPPPDSHPFSVIETTLNPFSVVETWLSEDL